MDIAFWIQWVTLALIVAVPCFMLGSRPNPWTVIAATLYVVSYFIGNAFHVALWTLEPPAAYGLALRLYTAYGLVMLTIYCGVLFFALTNSVLRKPDLPAKLIMLILLMAEAFQALEYIQCKMLTDPFGSGDLLLSQIWGIEVSSYACGRALGLLSPWIAPIITTTFTLWVLLVARRNNARVPRS